MQPENSLNPAKGKLFQKQTDEILSTQFGVEFQLDYPISIGNSPNKHKFDLVSADMRYVGECKNYSWTVSGNVPSVKSTSKCRIIRHIDSVFGYIIGLT